MLRKTWWQRKCCAMCHSEPDAQIRRAMKRGERQKWKKEVDKGL